MSQENNRVFTLQVEDSFFCFKIDAVETNPIKQMVDIHVIGFNEENQDTDTRLTAYFDEMFGSEFPFSVYYRMVDSAKQLFDSQDLISEYLSIQCNDQVAQVFNASKLKNSGNRLLASFPHSSPDNIVNILREALTLLCITLSIKFDGHKEKKPKGATKESNGKKSDTDHVFGRVEPVELIQIKDLTEYSGFVTVKGLVIGTDCIDFKSGDGSIFTYNITDYTNSITCKMILKKKSKTYDVINQVHKGDYLQVQGYCENDSFRKEIVINVKSITRSTQSQKTDRSLEKRIELHLHTKMSTMDSLVDVKSAIKKAAQYGHEAIAITDHGVVQAFPDAASAASRAGIKVIYGVEAYLFNDTTPAYVGQQDAGIQDTYVVFDVETTGFNPQECYMIEIGAVKVVNQEIVDRFSSFINPHVKLPEEIINLTGISDAMVESAPDEYDVMKDFIAFCGDAILVAHNAPFDMSFVHTSVQRYSFDFDPAYLDTVNFARRLLPSTRRFTLDSLCKKFNIILHAHHRAKDDAEATADLLLRLFEMASEQDVHSTHQINALQNRNLRPRDIHHAVILAQNKVGLKNLYKLISIAHLNYLFRGKPNIPRSALDTHREGLLLGSACEAGELYRAIIGKESDAKIQSIAEYYDYLEIQPLGNNQFMIEKGIVPDVNAIIEANKKIIYLGKMLNKPVVATGDVHFLESRDAYFRAILMHGQKFDDADNQASLYYRTTQEMLDEFTYLSEDEAQEVVIHAPKRVNEMIEDIEPLPEERLYPPKIPGAKEDIINLTYDTAHSIYGPDLPDVVQKRITKELDAITGYGFSVLYLIAHKLVKKSNEDGYLVGSRGSVGSSFVATMTGITEVNPLPPHYTCPKCFHSDFEVDARKYGCGPDLPNKDCPKCDATLDKRGYDIPFEVFLGFKGDKVPDIDLNFSGENQAAAHKYTEVLFGKGNVFRAGTISTLASKTAYGFVKNYIEEKGKFATKAEIERLIDGCVGVRRTTGQHPGGIIVVPHEYEVYDFTPIQHPADDKDSDIITTHFDFHSIHDLLVKLDILGHDDPTVLKMLHELTGLDPLDVPLDDQTTMSLFSSTEALGVQPEDINSVTGTYGVPEFGTKFVRGILIDTLPTTMAELIRISGLSHGTDVWAGNAKELIKNKTATLLEAICTRDDIMNALIAWGVPSKMSFDIMESVRKGKGLKEDMESSMVENNVPDWFINSCKLIKYMFPKAHAVAYVTMGFRVAYYKVYHPLEYYAAYFTVRADEFDSLKMVCSIDDIRKAIQSYEELGNKMSAKEKSTLTIWELVLEMRARGFDFAPIDLYESDASRFRIVDGKIMPPLDSLPSLGTKVAISICEARKDGSFNTINDFRERTGANKTITAMLQEIGCLDGVPESSQVSFFDAMM